MKVTGRTFISLGAVWLVGVFFPSAGALADLGEVTCHLNDQLVPEFQPKTPKDFCSPSNPADQKCYSMLKSIMDHSKGIRQGIDYNCKTMDETKSKLVQVSGQTDAQTQVITMYTDLLNVYKKLDQTLAKAEFDLEQKLRGTLGQAPAATTSDVNSGKIVAETKDLQEAMKTRASLDAFNVNRVPKTPDLGRAHNSKIHFASRNGFRFLKQVMAQRKQNAADMQKFQSTITGLTAQRDAMRKPPTPTTPPPAAPAAKTASTGLNPNTMMGLATAAAGLAGMMKKSQDADSGLPAATSPTPGSGNIAEKPAPMVSKLDDGKAKTSPVAPAPPAAEPAANPAPEAYAPSGGPLNEDSDISAPNPAPPAAPAMAKAPGGGGGNPGSDSSEGSQRGPSAAAAASPPSKDEEVMQGFGGGFGGGLGGGLGPSSGGMPPEPGMDPSVAAAEEGMKELLTDMKETVEGYGDGENQGDDGSIMAMDAEDLFPRVRAAHVRSLKQGKVLNGLGEKMTEYSE